MIWRKKAGFGAPVTAWLAGDLAPLADELLSPQTLADRGLVDPKVVERLRRENDLGIADNNLRLYALMTLELWSRTFLDRPWTFDRVDSPIATP